MTTATSIVAIGFNAGIDLTVESNVIALGNSVSTNGNNSINIGSGLAAGYTSCFIGGISGVTTGLTAVPVFIDTNGQLGTTSSSRRYKSNIVSMRDQTEPVMKLRPVNFIYKSDASEKLQYGLIAEEVAEIYPELVVHDKDGEIYTIQYMNLIPILLTQVQHLEKQNQKQDMQIQELHTMIQGLKELIKK